MEVNLTNAPLVEQIDEGWSVFCTKGSAKRAVLQVTTIQRTPVSRALDTVRFAWTPDAAKNVSEDITLPKMYVRNIVAEKVKWKILTLKIAYLVQKDARTASWMTQESAQHVFRTTTCISSVAINTAQKIPTEMKVPCSVDSVLATVIAVTRISVTCVRKVFISQVTYV